MLGRSRRERQAAADGSRIVAADPCCAAATLAVPSDTIRTLKPRAAHHPDAAYPLRLRNFAPTRIIRACRIFSLAIRVRRDQIVQCDMQRSCCRTHFLGVSSLDSGRDTSRPFFFVQPENGAAHARDRAGLKTKRPGHPRATRPGRQGEERVVSPPGCRTAVPERDGRRGANLCGPRRADTIRRAARRCRRGGRPSRSAARHT